MNKFFCTLFFIFIIPFFHSIPIQASSSIMTCDEITITHGNGQIKMTGQSGKEYFFQVSDENWAPVFNCGWECGHEQTATGLTAGKTYRVKVSNSSWQVICETTITLGGGGCTDNDSDGVCAGDDCDDNDASVGAKQPVGTACDDGNSNTTNDKIQSDGCTCAGTTDNGGGGTTETCGEITITHGNGQIKMAGQSGKEYFFQVSDENWASVFNCGWQCGHEQTATGLTAGKTYRVKVSNSSWQVICETTITLGGGGCTDNDNDGVCAGDDCDDNDASVGAKQPVGTACDDGNSNTTNDKIQSDGCTCAGTTDNGGGGTTETCGEITIIHGNGQIKMTGQSGKEYFFQVSDENWASVFNCGWQCGHEQTATGLTAGKTYRVKVSNSSWQVICETTITLGGGGCTDNDNDGVCAGDDCDDNDASVGAKQPVGTACDDGNSNTTNDKIQADGCTCAGTTDNGGGGTTETCGEITITHGNGQIKMAGQSGKEYFFQVSDENWAPVFNCGWQCGYEQTATGLTDGATYRVKVSNSSWQVICETTITLGGGEPNCDNFTDGGKIGFGDHCNGLYTICGSAGNAMLIENCIPPSGGSGEVEIIWLKSTTSCDPPTTTIANILNDPHWSIIPGAISETYHPGTLSETTCFLRCARRAGCLPYTGESNIIKVEVDPSCGNPCANKGGDSDGDGVCAADDCNDNNSSIGAKKPVGTACDDGDSNTTNDKIQADGCTCKGVVDPCANKGGDWDGDGVCAADDCNDNDSSIGAKKAPGTACNDNDPNTTNDKIQADGCTCKGVVDPCANKGGDSDGDGICAADDCNDNNSSIGAKKPVGTACDDGDSNTTDDKIQADGCTCKGTPSCPSLSLTSVSTSACGLKVSYSVTAGYQVELKLQKYVNSSWTNVSGENWVVHASPHNYSVSAGTYRVRARVKGATTTCWQGTARTGWVSKSVTCCNGATNPIVCEYYHKGSWKQDDCSVTVCAGDYLQLSVNPNEVTNWTGPNGSTFNQNNIVFSAVKASDAGNYTATFTKDGCEFSKTISLTVQDCSSPCDNAGGDADGDGVCANNDCNDNNSSIGAKKPVGTACNDGDSNTTDDKIQADGCTCKGTPSSGGCPISSGNVTVNVTKKPDCNGGVNGEVTVCVDNWQSLGTWETKPEGTLTSWGHCTQNCFIYSSQSKGSFYVLVRKYNDTNSSCYVRKLVVIEENCGSTCNPPVGSACTTSNGQAGTVQADCSCKANTTSCQLSSAGTISSTVSATCNGTLTIPSTSAATGTGGTISYKWYKMSSCGNYEGSAISTSRDLTITAPSQAGTYYYQRWAILCNNGAWSNCAAVTVSCGGGCTVGASCWNGSQWGTYDANCNCVVATSTCTQYSVSNVYNNCSSAGTCYGQSIVGVMGASYGCLYNVNLTFTEYADRAELKGYINTQLAGQQYVNVTFTGKTTAGTPYYDLCKTSGASGWTYYTSFSGTIGSKSVSRKGGAFQVGYGASLIDPNSYGASGWFYENGQNVGISDFNFLLTGGTTCSGSRSIVKDFTANKANRAVQLEWVTNTEYMNERYIIERSEDGESYETLKEVNSETTSFEAEYYKITDANPLQGWNYYRLKKVHFDGSFEYFEPQKVNFNIDLESISVFPNPVKEALFVNLKPYVGRIGTLQLTNQYGQVVKEMQLENIPAVPLTLPVSQVPNGVYYLSIQVENNRPVLEKVIINRLY